MSLFISFEGPDGSGKSLQMDLLAEDLRLKGLDVLTLREPGGTVIGEDIRSVLLDPSHKEMDPVTEAYLYAASRAQLVREKIRPALEKGTIVLLDRFIDSSYVYQGIARGLGVDTVQAINRYALDGLMPDATFLVYIDYEEGLRRKKLQEGHSLDRLEQEKDRFHQKVNEGYRSLKDLSPGRVRLIDGTGSIQQVHSLIWSQMQDLLSQKGFSLD